MPGYRAKSLSSLLSSVIQTKPKPKTLKPSKTLTIVDQQSSSSSFSSSKPDDSALRLFVSSLGTPSLKPPPNTDASSSSSSKKASELDSLSNFASSVSKSQPCSDSDVEESKPRVNKKTQLTTKISSILIADESEGSSDEEGSDDDWTPLPEELGIPWLPSLSHSSLSLRRKDVVRDRKLKWVFSSSQGGRFHRLVKMCAQKVGADTAFDLFGKLGQATGVKEYKALIKVCIEMARNGDEEVALEQIHRAFVFFSTMKEYGYELEEDTYGPFLAYLIDTAMVDEFFFFCDVIQGVNPSSSSKLGYYEMSLWIKVDDKQKIQDLCNYIATEECGKVPGLRENYLLALCEGGRETELLQLLDTVDVTEFTSIESIEAIFKTLGKLQLEALVEKFLLAFRACNFKAEDFSNFLFCYAAGNPNLAVEDVIKMFSDLHAKHEMKPSFTSYEKLLKYCCESHEVVTALDLVDSMIEEGMTVSVKTINYILRTCEETYNFNLVHRVYSMICDHNLEANHETFSTMINLCLKIKNVDAAHNMLSHMQKMKLAPTPKIYNIMMAGCFREKNSYGALKVLKLMEEANIKPDSKTFSYLISNSVSEEYIDKYFEELKRSGIQATKTVYMALIHAYASCGLFDKAKQVVSEKWIPVKNLNEIKSTLVQALATNGQMSEALKLYEEIKRDGFSLEPKAAISIIEHYDSDGGSSTLLQLLGELTDPENWLDGCSRIIYYCIQHKDLSPAIELLKQLKDKLYDDHELVLEAILDEMFCVIGDLEPPDMQIGLDMLHVVKDDLGLAPPRKCLDFLLHACVNAKDFDSARLIWKEYAAAGLPYNILTYLRMYQALLASGNRRAAAILLTKIPTDDQHVQYIIKSCQATYTGSVILETKKKKKTTKKIY